jgi:adenylate cyclase
MEEETPPPAVPGELFRTILFVDLSSFTPLTEAMGDTVAARVVERFSEMVRDAAAECVGQVVKQIGDAFMLVFPDTRSAVVCGLKIEHEAAAEHKFPAVRIGAHAGSVLYREGDYVGMNVNIAARVAAAATPHQLLVTDAVRVQATDIADVEFLSLGFRSLKGLTEQVHLFEVQLSQDRPVKVADPVCGMELDSTTVDARLNWRGEELWFCSTGCLQRFADAPEHYRGPAGP